MPNATSRWLGGYLQCPEWSGYQAAEILSTPKEGRHCVLLVSVKKERSKDEY